MGVGNSKAIGKHEDLATCIEYSEEKRKILVECNPLVICLLLPFTKDVHESGGLLILYLWDDNECNTEDLFLNILMSSKSR